MKTPHFLVTALVVISQSATAYLSEISLWGQSFAIHDRSNPIPRNTDVTLWCTKYGATGNVRWTFIRPEDHMLVTAFSRSLRLASFNESHVGNYQCRIFPYSGGDVIWRTITLCLAKSGMEETCDEENESSLPEMSKSAGVQVIKFNLLPKPGNAFLRYDYSELTDLANLNSREETLYSTGAAIPLTCPFNETKNSSLIWMTDRKLKYGKLEWYNRSPVNILRAKREGWYDCLVGNSSGYVRHRFVVKTGFPDIDEKARPGYIDVKLLIFNSCGIISFIAATGALFFYLWKSKRGSLRRDIVTPQSRMAADLIDRPASYLELLDQEEESPGVKMRTDSDIESIEEGDHSTHENAAFTPWNLRLDNLLLGDILRENNFCTLYRARLVNILRERSINVVVKMSKGSTDSDLLALVSEMQIMESIGRHPNVVGLLGTCTETKSLFFVMEFAEHGNLRDHLREWGSTLESEYTDKFKPESDRLPVHIVHVSYAYQVAMGMNYLASRKCVHKGLQTKRVLISKGDILKIADYATKRVDRVNFQAVTSGDNQLSVRWMAPETLFRGIHSTEANVWSYGILLWEIMTFAATPYPQILTTEELMARLKLGYYMGNPNYCPADIYELMRKCWNENPARRPRFDQLVEDLDRMFKKLSIQLRRLESDNYQQGEYANPTCLPLRKLTHDGDYNNGEYDDVVHLIGEK